MPGSGREATSVKSSPKAVPGAALAGSRPTPREGCGEQRWAPSKDVSVGTSEPRCRHGQQSSAKKFLEPQRCQDGAAEAALCHGGVPRGGAGLGSAGMRGGFAAGQRSSTAKPPPLSYPPSTPSPCHSRSFLPHSHTRASNQMPEPFFRAFIPWRPGREPSWHPGLPPGDALSLRAQSARPQWQQLCLRSGASEDQHA